MPHFFDEPAVAGNYAVELDRQSRAALSAVGRTVNVRLKTDARSQGIAGVISEDEIAEVRQILGIQELIVGDVIVLPDDSTPFFISKATFENLYEVLTQ